MHTITIFGSLDSNKGFWYFLLSSLAQNKNKQTNNKNFNQCYVINGCIDILWYIPQPFVSRRSLQMWDIRLMTSCDGMDITSRGGNLFSLITKLNCFAIFKQRIHVSVFKYMHFITGFVVGISLMQADAKEHALGVVSKMSLVTRKPVFGVCNQLRLKLVCSATETS